MGESRLVMNQGPQAGQTFTLDIGKELITLGRDPNNDIVIGDPQVSRQHARIVRREGMLVLEDIGSTNGTFVNGVRLTGPHTLSDGDVINLGDTVTLTFYGTGPAVTVPLGGAEPAVTTTPPAYAPPPAYAAAPPPPPPPDFPAEAAASDKSKIWWIGCGCLAVVLLCVAVGLFLWYAPASFWQTLQNFGVPIPPWPF